MSGDSFVLRLCGNCGQRILVTLTGERFCPGCAVVPLVEVLPAQRRREPVRIVA